MKYLLLSIVSLFAVESFGLHETNCVSMDGQYVRQEHEIWGANPVVWTRGGKDISIEKEEFLGINAKNQVLPLMNLGDKNTTERKLFHAHVKLHENIGGRFPRTVITQIAVLCGAWSNNAKDLAPRKGPSFESNLQDLLK